MADKRILICAPNGPRKMKADHPAVPLTPQELALCAEEVLAAGASILHLHIRDDAGGHSLSVPRYREAVAAIRDRVGDGLVIQATTEAVGMYDRIAQMQVVKELKPEAVSLAVRELFPEDTSVQECRDFSLWMQDEGVWPQYILYDDADTARLEALCEAGAVQEAPFVLKVVGKKGDTSHALTDTDFDFVSRLEALGSTWAACGFGKAENHLAGPVMKSGGHLRVGFENNLHLMDGRTAKNNAALVAQNASAFENGGHKISTAKEVRARFGLRR